MWRYLLYNKSDIHSNMALLRVLQKSKLIYVSIPVKNIYAHLSVQHIITKRGMNIPRRPFYDDSAAQIHGYLPIIPSDIMSETHWCDTLSDGLKTDHSSLTHYSSLSSILPFMFSVGLDNRAVLCRVKLTTVLIFKQLDYCFFFSKRNLNPNWTFY